MRPTPDLLTNRLLQAMSLAALLGAGCGGLTPVSDEAPPPEDADGEGEALDLEFADYDLAAERGGMDEGDEEPGFGRRGFDREFDEDAEGPEGVPERAEPDAVYLRILWGQLRGNAEAECGIDWTGGLAARGLGVRVERVIRFEPRDHLVERETRSRLDWVSHTRPHFDGVLVSLRRLPLPEEARLRPDDEDEPGRALRELTFRTTPLTETFAGRELADLDVVIPVDRCGNAVSFTAVAELPGPGAACRRGFMSGRWAPREEGRGGVFGGKVETVLGRVIGHLRGAYGVRQGEPVLFGKIVDRDGRFIGLLRGTWERTDEGEGTYRGVWIGRGGEHHGVLGGHWRALPRVPGGNFHGRWSERCALPVCDEAAARPDEDDPNVEARPERQRQPDADAAPQRRPEPADGERQPRPDADDAARPDADDAARPEAQRAPFDLVRRRLVGGLAGLDVTLDVLGIGQARLAVAHAHARCATVRHARLTPEQVRAVALSLEGLAELEAGYDCNELTDREIVDAPDLGLEVRRGERSKQVRVASAVCWNRLPETLVEVNQALDAIAAEHFPRPARDDQDVEVE